MTDANPPFSIGHIAKQLNLRPSTIHFYERQGLIPLPRRTDSGRRLYDQEDLHRLSLLLAMKEIGFNLEDMRAAIKLYEHDAPCIISFEFRNEHAAQIRRKYAALMKLCLAIPECSTAHFL